VSVTARRSRLGRRGLAARRSRAATRAHLLAAGRALFCERGLHGVTSHTIAAEAGVAAGTFYLHFRDKAELFREVAEDALARLRQRLDAATAGARGARESVPALSEALISFAEENRDVVRLLFSRATEAADVEADVLDQLASSVAEHRRARIAAGELAADLDPDVAAQALVGLLARVVAWWTEDPSRASREVVIETLTRIQLSGTHPI
jgi:AcrR family transcriptional regulator